MRGYLCRVDEWCENHQAHLLVVIAVFCVFGGGIVEGICRLVGW